MIQLLDTFFDKGATKQKFCTCLLSNIDWDTHQITLISVSQVDKKQIREIIELINGLVAKQSTRIKFAYSWYTKTIAGKTLHKLNLLLWIESVRHVRFLIENVLDKFQNALILWNDLVDSTDRGEDQRLLQKYVRQIADILSPPSHLMTTRGYKFFKEQDPPSPRKIRLRLLI